MNFLRIDEFDHTDPRDWAILLCASGALFGAFVLVLFCVIVAVGLAS